MPRLFVLFVVINAAMIFSSPLLAAEPEPAPAPPRRLAPERPLRLYDFRVFQASPGNLDALHARIRDHQIPLLEQHGIFTQGVFVPAGENPNQFVYLLTAAEESVPMAEGWIEFGEDPKWLEVLAATDKDKNGKLVAREGYQRLRSIHCRRCSSLSTPPSRVCSNSGPTCALITAKGWRCSVASGTTP
jgi:hypothetical protein